MIRLPFLNPRPREYTLEPLTAEHSTALARLHGEDFVRPWSEDEFAALLSEDTVFGFAVREIGNPRLGSLGFVLARMAAGEAEILTVAVSRAYRQLGLGWKLMDAVLRDLHRERAEALFLEVDETNTPALALYRRLGFHQVGKRPGYYRATDGAKTGALVMRRDLR